MSQLYGFFAGLVGCASTWGAMAVLSHEVGWLVGIFLLVFLTVTTVYSNSEEIQERQDRASKALRDMETIFSGKLRQIERQIEGLEEEGGAHRKAVSESPPSPQEWDAMLHLLEHILHTSDTEHDPADHTTPVASAGIGHQLT